MSRHALLAGCLAASVALIPGVVSAQSATNAAPAAPAATSAAAYSTATTSIGALLDNPAAKAIVAKYAPEFVANPGIDQARGMTLKDVQGYAGDQLSDAVLAKMDADLAALPAAAK